MSNDCMLEGGDNHKISGFGWKGWILPISTEEMINYIILFSFYIVEFFKDYTYNSNIHISYNWGNMGHQNFENFEICINILFSPL